MLISFIFFAVISIPMVLPVGIIFKETEGNKWLFLYIVSTILTISSLVSLFLLFLLPSFMLSLSLVFFLLLYSLVGIAYIGAIVFSYIWKPEFYKVITKSTKEVLENV